MSPEYFSQFTAMPDALSGIDDVLAHELAGITYGPATPRQRAQALLGGNRLSASAIKGATIVDDFVDARHVHRSPAGIALHLGRLILPDDAADLRDRVADLVGMTEPDELGEEITALHELAPEVATALLELRPGRAWALLKIRIANGAADPELHHYESVITEIARLRVLYRLQLDADACAAPLHAPFGWAALDGLAKQGTLRMHKVLSAFRAELKLIEKAFDLYLDHERRPLSPPSVSLTPPVASMTSMFVLAAINLPVSSRDAAPFRIQDLEDRARVQLAIWRRLHGANLEYFLGCEIRHRRKQLLRLRRAIEAKARRLGPNTVIGNADAENAGLILWFAIEASVAWTAEQVLHADRDEAQATSDALVADPAGPGAAIGRAVRIMQVAPGKMADLARPTSHPDHAFIVAELFDIYRVVFLRDDEMLPASLRQVRDRVTGESITIRSHVTATEHLGKPYTHDEILAGYEADRQRKLNPNTPWPDHQRDARRAQAMTRRTEYRDKANAFPTIATRKRQARMEGRTRAFHAFVMRGLTTA